jgi:hypothetical protein
MSGSEASDTSPAGSDGSPDAASGAAPLRPSGGDVAADADEGPPPAREADQPTGGRRWVPALLIVLATVVAVVSATTTWVRTQALDTDSWVDASSEVLESSEVQDALATYLVDQLYANVDVKAEFESLLPEDLSRLAGPLAGALRVPATTATERVLAAPRFQQIWEDANRRAHEILVAIIRDETRPNVSTANGAVVLDLAGAVRSVGENLGVPQAALDRIPADVGQITVFSSSDLADVQDAVKVLDVLSWFLFIVVVLLYVLAVYLARGRRRAALRNTGLALVAGGVVLLAARVVGVRTAIDSIVADPANRPAAQVVGDIFTELLRDMAWTGIVLGVLIALYAALLGPHAWAIAVRRRLASSSSPDGIIAGTTVALLVILVWWTPGHIFDRWVTALTMLGLIIGAAIALAVTIRRETFEDSGTSEDGGASEDGGTSAGEVAPAETSSGPAPA